MAQVALACILLAGAGLFWKSFENATTVDLGFDAKRILTIELPGLARLGHSSEQIHASFERLAETAIRVHGVESVALTSSLPFRAGMQLALKLRNSRSWHNANFVATTPDYLQTMGMRLLRGRAFEVNDSESSAPIAIVSASLANLCWLKQNPIGDCAYLGAGTPFCTDIVGVASDCAVGRFDTSEPQIFVPLSQLQRYSQRGCVGGIVIRLAQDGVSSMELERALAAALPQTYVRVRSLYSEVAPQFGTWERGRILFACLGGIALGVALIGYHAQLAQLIAARRREIGVRIALGATPRNIRLLVLRQGLWLAGGGLVLGLVGSVLLSLLMESLFYGVRGTDLLILARITALLLVMTLAVSLLSCWKALKVSPMESLRYE
jgi:hypothetical protein